MQAVNIQAFLIFLQVNQQQMISAEKLNHV